MSVGKPMSFLFRWREAIYASDLTPTTRHVLHVLSFHGDEDGRNCFPSLASLARKTGHDRKTCWKAVQRGRAGGWITAAGRIAFDGSKANSGRGHRGLSTVSYSLAIPETVGVVPPVPIPETVGVGSETVGPTPPNLISTSSLTSSSSRASPATFVAKDDDDLFEQVAKLEATRRTDARIATNKLAPSKRRAYAAKVAHNLQREEGDAIREAIAANPGASALELVELVWPARSDGQREYGGPVLPFTNGPCFVAMGRQDEDALDSMAVPAEELAPEIDMHDDPAPVTAPNTVQLEASKAAAMERLASLRTSVATIPEPVLDQRRQADKAKRGRARAGNGQLRRLDAASNAAGLDRAEMIAAAGKVIGRPIDTLKALTNDEADAVLAAFASKEIR